MRKGADQARPKRVIINAFHAKSGGGVTYLQNILKYFAEDRDLEFHLFLHEDQYDLFVPLPEGIHLHLFDFRHSFWRLLLWEQLALPLLARLMSADLTFSPANYGPIFAPGRVIMLRNAVSTAGDDTRLRKRIYWLSVAFITLVSLLVCKKAIAVSNFAAHQLTFGIKYLRRSKTEIIYHGINESFAPRRDIDRDHPYILLVSDIYFQKNLHTLIDALPAVIARFPEIKLRIAGQPNDQDYFRRLQKKAHALKLDGSIEYLGHCGLDTLIDLYSRCTFLVFPSIVETFGNPIVEAMASGVPIASSNSSAMPEVAGDAAIFFNPFDAAEMSAALIRLLEDPALAKRLSEMGIERAKTFSWKKAALATCGVLKSAAG